MSKQQKLIQSLGELAFPLIGMFYLEWSLYFIALYYLLDTIANEIFFHVEMKTIYVFHGRKQKDKSVWLLNGSIQLILFIIITFLVHFAIPNIYPKMDVKLEFWKFLMYEEEFMPFPQVYVLLPLVLLPKYMQYKNDFLTKQKQSNFTGKTYTLLRRRAWLLTLALVATLSALSSLVHFPVVIWLFCAVVPKLVYDIWIVKY